MKRQSLTPWLIVGVFVVFMVIRYWPASQDSTPSVAEATAIPITAENLHAAYVRNAVAADYNFKGTVVAVSGIVHSMAMFGDEPVVNLFGSDRRGGVQCYFDKSQREAIMKLERGERATFKCKGDGFYEDVVLATKCIVQSPHP